MTEMITPGQVKQIRRLCEDALDAMEITKEAAQEVIKEGGKFKQQLQEKLRAIINELGLPYADEQVPSNYGYPDGFRIRSVAEQAETLLQLFPNLDASHVAELASGELPEWAEGWAVIPKPEKVGKTYHEMLETALGHIAKDRKFQNWREGALTEKHLRLKEKTAQVHAELNKQPGDFWVFPFQFGMKWRGYSVRKAQSRFADNEFGLGPYEVAILLFTHPDRITGSDQLYIDCAGCGYRPDADGDFFACLHFYWYGHCKRLALGCRRADGVDRQWGAASGSLAQ